ncbi:MAG TPA: hypothetical protein VE326_12700 [Candidatus Binatia bacterium]|nr:hypothetical protein [Candidatus Binatia bacterium]
MKQTDDYLLRQIQTVADMIARAAGLRLEGSPDEARAVLEQAYGVLLAGQTALIRRLDAGTAASLLGSPERILMLARLFEEESELDGNPALRERTIELTREALRRDPENDEAKVLLAKWSAP